MAHSYLKMHGQSLTLIQFGAEYSAIFGSHMKKPTKVNVAANMINTAASSLEEKVKPYSQTKKRQEKENIQAPTAFIEQQKRETEKLKTTQSAVMTPQILVMATTQTMLCLYLGDSKKTLEENKKPGTKPFLGKLKPPEI